MTSIVIASERTINGLNAAAAARRELGDDMDVSFIDTMRSRGYAELGESGGCVLYQSRSGRLVNCWTTAAEGVTDFGFDSQVEIHQDESYYPG